MSLFRGEKPILGTTNVVSSAAVDVALTVKAGESTQTANLIEAKNSAGTVVLSVDNTGVVKAGSGAVIIQTTEPLAFAIPAATQAVNQAVFISDNTYQVTGVNAVWGTASTSGTVTVEKLTGTTAPGSGTAMLTGTISTAGTANTVTAGTLTGTVGTLQLAAGDRLGLVFSGTETNLVGLCVVVSIKRI